MSDIVERLREQAELVPAVPRAPWKAMAEAADEITRLRAALAQPEPEPAAHLYDDGTWIATQTAAGRSLNDRMLFAGSPKIGVYTVATPPAAPIDGFGGNLDEAFERAPAVREPLPDGLVAHLEQQAFASTNHTPERPLYQHWFRVGVRAGYGIGGGGNG